MLHKYECRYVWIQDFFFCDKYLRQIVYREERCVSQCQSLWMMIIRFYCVSAHGKAEHHGASLSPSSNAIKRLDGVIVTWPNQLQKNLSLGNQSFNTQVFVAFWCKPNTILPELRSLRSTRSFRMTIASRIVVRYFHFSSENKEIDH